MGVALIGLNGMDTSVTSHRSGRSRFPPLPLPGVSPPQQGQPRPSHLILRVRPPNRVGGVGHAGESILALLAVLLANRRVWTLEHRLQPGLGGNPRVHRVYRVLSQNGVCRIDAHVRPFPVSEPRRKMREADLLTGQKILGMHEKNARLVGWRPLPGLTTHPRFA